LKYSFLAPFDSISVRFCFWELGVSFNTTFDDWETHFYYLNLYWFCWWGVSSLFSKLNVKKLTRDRSNKFNLLFHFSQLELNELAVLFCHKNKVLFNLIFYIKVRDWLQNLGSCQTIWHYWVLFLLTFDLGYWNLYNSKVPRRNQQEFNKNHFQLFVLQLETYLIVQNWVN
jgi:hypothetical protein